MYEGYLVSDHPRETASLIRAYLSPIYNVKILKKGWSRRDIAVVLGDRQVWVLRELTTDFFVGRRTLLGFNSSREAANWLGAGKNLKRKEEDMMPINKNDILTPSKAWEIYAPSQYKRPDWNVDEVVITEEKDGGLSVTGSLTWTGNQIHFKESGFVPTIKHIQTNEKKGEFYTTVIWNDNTKPTVVKLSKDDPYDLYFAVASAIAIKVYGSNSAYKRMIKDKMEVK